MQNEKPLHGIRCEVDSCVYNDGACHCCAQQVNVKNRMAILGEETMCGTFEEV